MLFPWQLLFLLGWSARIGCSGGVEEGWRGGNQTPPRFCCCCTGGEGKRGAGGAAPSCKGLGWRTANGMSGP